MIRSILLALAGLLALAVAAQAATVRVEYVRVQPGADGVSLSAVDQSLDATGVVTVTAGAPLTGASRLVVPAVPDGSRQIYARVTVLDGAIIARRNADAASSGAGLYASAGDVLHFPVSAGDTISMIETTPVSGGAAGLTDAQLRATPLPVQGSRPNAGTGLDAGGSHLTVGGSDGVNVRPMRVAPDGRLVSTIPTAGSTGNGAVTTPAAGGAACTTLPSQPADLIEFAVSTSGAQVEYQVGGSGAFFPDVPGLRRPDPRHRQPQRALRAAHRPVDHHVDGLIQVVHALR